MDFGMLPPEVNSGRMYSGPGAGPMLAAAAAWDSLAGELGSVAASHQTVLAGLTSRWQGPASAAMTAAATPYVSWLSATAAQADHTAGQARAAAAAYQMAFVATVPPPAVAANRSLLMSLLATNILGQNTPAIAATETAYAEMWAQDAAAMYGYAGASAAAADLTPFTAPSQTTDPGGSAGQAGAVAQAIGTSTGANAQSELARLIFTVPQLLQGFAAPVSSAAAAPAQSSLSSFIDFILGPLSPISFIPIGGVPYLLGIQNVMLPLAGQNVASALAKAAAAPAAAGVSGSPPGTLVSVSVNGSSGAGPAVSAGMGRAGFVDGLSVPRNWTATPAQIRTLTATVGGTGPDAVPAAAPLDGQGGLLSGVAVGALAGRALGANGGAASRAAVVTGERNTPTTTIIVIPDSDDE